MIELLIVIGIIGVLTTAMLVATRSSTESARAAKCMANIHSLAAAANARAMESGSYPLAGSREVVCIDATNHRTVRDEQVGWISWLSNQGDPYGHHSEGGTLPTGHQTVDNCPFYGTGNEDDVTYALTNGVIWRYVGQNREVYVCPAHARYRAEHGMKRPYWSYVMNKGFGYDYSNGDKSTATGGAAGDYRYGEVEKADRILMFAELPTVDFKNGEESPHEDGELTECDCVLQNKATVDGHEYGKEWQGKVEAIGFNHKAGKRDRYGHVAFADGHVEKITYGKAGLKPEELTALLCNGVDAAFDGAGWKKITDQD